MAYFHYEKSFNYISVVGSTLLFATAQTRGTLNPANPFPFPNVVTLRGEGQWASNRFTITEASGLYFVGLSVGPQSRTRADYTLNIGSQRLATISRTATAHTNHGMASRDIIIPMYAAETMHVSSGQRTFTDGFLQTSLTVFSVSNCMVNDLVAFSVARHDTLSGSANPVSFSEVLVNEGLSYDPFTHTLIAYTAGIYYFSFSVGVNPSAHVDFALYKNDELFCNIIRTSNRHNGGDTIGRAIMMELDVGNTVHIVNAAGRVARSSVLKETSFSGFKYEPRHGNQVWYLFQYSHPIC